MTLTLSVEKSCIENEHFQKVMHRKIMFGDAKIKLLFKNMNKKNEYPKFTQIHLT